MRFVLILTFVFYKMIAFSQAIKPITKNKNWESWRDRVPVGAEFNVGIMDLKSEAKINPSSFYVKIPFKHDKVICVEFNSKDGKYTGKLEYDISNLKLADIYQFEIPTNYGEKLKQYKENEVAIIVKASSCSSNMADFFIASWHKINSTYKTFIYINSETPVILKLVKNNLKTGEIECKKMHDVTAISYNCECEIPIEKLAKCESIHLMKVVRIAGEPKPKSHGEIKIKI